MLEPQPRSLDRAITTPAACTLEAQPEPRYRCRISARRRTGRLHAMLEPQLDVG
eukprot:CAMPEP_0173451972 /NCGR_PEP_ID=MMETSP1357-20121228/47806_1 /TAXON_ID=77926 /ORGANISM="Hemiselmis rufescens, Strain PCC563" /LENGTH=53 /DNA_ID=CAMNT_0014418791 /DNA_START=62 /DNA_END=220 /DNA_ORIENTATION=-